MGNWASPGAHLKQSMSEKEKSEAVGAATPKYSPKGRFPMNDAHAINSPKALSIGPEYTIVLISTIAAAVAAATPSV